MGDREGEYSMTVFCLSALRRGWQLRHRPQTFISMATGSTPPSPLTWEYTNESNEQLAEENRLCRFCDLESSCASRPKADISAYLGGIRSLIVLAFFLVFLGVVYQASNQLRLITCLRPADRRPQLPGSMASERASLLTSHLEAMGCRKSARVM